MIFRARISRRVYVVRARLSRRGLCCSCYGVLQWSMLFLVFKGNAYAFKRGSYFKLAFLPS